MRMKPLILVPHPQSLQQSPEHFELPAEGILKVHEKSLFAIASVLQQDLQNLHHKTWEICNTTENSSDSSKSVNPLFSIHFLLTDSKEILQNKEAYQISITPQQIRIVASEIIGAFYAVMTLRQILRQCKTHLPLCEIHDFPNFPTRGVLLDISRDKIPTLFTLYHLIDQLAEWKINQLQLYTEHSFAYSQHPSVWENATPYTGDDILKIQAYAQSRFIELVPNQNSFGHMERWLKLPEYKELAECPEGFTWPWGVFNPEPFSLAPEHPGSFELIQGLYEELLPHFESPLFNVNCDETLDLGQGKSKDVCDSQGKSTVYFDFLMKIYDEVKKHGRTLLFWADILAEHPELLERLPQDVIALEWGYEADHPFQKRGGALKQAQIPFYVCPGTSSWCSIVGRMKNMLENTYRAAHEGLAEGAIGYLITDWGDLGHWQYLPLSYAGLLAGAAFAWNTETHKEDDFVEALNLHVFLDESQKMGKLSHELGNLYLQTPHLKNQTRLFQWIFKDTEHSAFKNLEENKLLLLQEKLRACASDLKNHRMQTQDATLIEAEFHNAIQILHYGIQRALAECHSKYKTPSSQSNLKKLKNQIREEHTHLWLSRNRKGGLQDSLAHFENNHKT